MEEFITTLLSVISFICLLIVLFIFPIMIITESINIGDIKTCIILMLLCLISLPAAYAVSR